MQAENHPLAGKPRSRGKSTLMWTRLKDDEMADLLEQKAHVEQKLGHELTQSEFFRGIVRHWMDRGHLRVHRTDP
jgi:hypothetical protein